MRGHTLRATWQASVLLAAILLAVASGASAVGGEAGGLWHELVTDAPAYAFGDTVIITYTITNVTDSPITWTMSCCGVYEVLLAYSPTPIWAGDAIWADPEGCMPEICYATLEPGESSVQVSAWDMVNRFTGQPVWYAGTYHLESEFWVVEPELQIMLELDFEILDSATQVPDDLEQSWSVIKSLYR